MYFIKHIDHIFEGLGVREVIGFADSIKLSEINGLVLRYRGLVEECHDDDFHTGLFEFLDASFLDVKRPVLR